MISEYNGLGYSGTNSGGNLTIVNSTFRFNRAGIVPNSGSYELCYPERDTTIVGNIVHDNNQADTPAIDVALLAMGNGILLTGGMQQHDRAQPRVRPRPHRHRPRALPRGGARTTECRIGPPGRRPARRSATTRPTVTDPADLALVLWDSVENSVVGNEVSGSGLRRPDGGQPGA